MLELFRPLERSRTNEAETLEFDNIFFDYY